MTVKEYRMACGWCKGYIHDAWISDMQLYVHDVTPTKPHEILPYREDAWCAKDYELAQWSAEEEEHEANIARLRLAGMMVL